MPGARALCHSPGALVILLLTVASKFCDLFVIYAIFILIMIFMLHLIAALFFFNFLDFFSFS